MTAKEKKQYFMESTAGLTESDIERLDDCIKAYCKEQREECAKALGENDIIYKRYKDVLNAPEPEL